MKENEVIKDFKKQKFILFAEKKDGSYGEVEGGSYIIENDLDDFWKKKIHLENTIREQLLKSEISPIKYFMTLEELTVSELAKRARLCKCKVKKHLTNNGFFKATVNDLKKYSEVFGVNIASLFQIVLSEDGQNINFHLYNKEDVKTNIPKIIHTSTSNPLMIFTKLNDSNR